MGDVAVVTAAAVRQAQKRLGRRGVPFTADVARRICRRLESGEGLRTICRDPALPDRSSVHWWIKRLPVFAASVARSRAAAGWVARGASQPLWSERLGAEVCMRVAQGARLADIDADPEMPSMSTIYRWRATRPEFARAYAEARAMVAEQLADLGWEIAQKVTPQDAFATQVKLQQLRWTAGCFDPSRFGRYKPVERPAEEAAAGAGAGAGPQEVVFRVRQFEQYVDGDGRARLRELFPDGEEPAPDPP